MPVYHVDAFDVSAVQIDLSANIFTADSANLSADYWVRRKVNFNSGGAIRSDVSLNFIFKNIADSSWGDLGNSDVSRNSTGRSNIFADATTAISDSGVRVKFKDLGVIKADHSLYTNSLYSNVDTLRTNNSTTTTTFVGKVNARLQSVTSVTGLREKMLASINVGSDPDRDLTITDPVPNGSDSQFGFLVVRNLNLAGTSQDLATHIGVVLEQDNSIVSESGL